VLPQNPKLEIINAILRIVMEFYIAVTLRTYFVTTICPEKCPLILCPEEIFFLCLGLVFTKDKMEFLPSSETNCLK